MEDYEWQTPDLNEFAARVKDRLGDNASPKIIERTACVVHYEDLYDAIVGGGKRGDNALDEMFVVRWHEGVDGAPAVSYRGYLFRSAYHLLQQRLQGAEPPIPHDQLAELAIHVATAARMKTALNIHQVHAREAFWGWLAVVLRHEVSHELKGFSRRPGDDDLPDDARVWPEDETATERIEVRVAVLDELKRKARLKRLTADQVRILFWDWWENLSNIEIAERLTAQRGERMSANKVGHVKHAAVNILRDNLRESGWAI